eukprot:174186-Pyramimonas_sp.AAC.1
MYTGSIGPTVTCFRALYALLGHVLGALWDQLGHLNRLYRTYWDIYKGRYGTYWNMYTGSIKPTGTCIRAL